MIRRRIKAIVQYDGTDYGGFQRQVNAKTVQGTLELGLARVLGHPVTLRAAGRTDKGVHARGQVVSFETDSTIPAGRLSRAVGSYLPKDIVVAGAWEVTRDFDPLKDAVSKTYCYRLWRGKVVDLFWSRYAYHYPWQLDFGILEEESKAILGKHDFANFQARGSSAKTTVRTVLAADWERKDELWEFTITADGFLYKMVRLIVGTLLDTGRGRFPKGTMALALRKIPERSGTCAPPNGLCLEKVQFS